MCQVCADWSRRAVLGGLAATRAARVATHRPVASVLSCSDARAAPGYLFDQGPGDLFVVRVAGNVLTDEGLAPAAVAAEAGHPANLLNAAIVENARRTTQAVASAQPLLSAMVANGKVKVAGGVYDIATGSVSLS